MVDRKLAKVSLPTHYYCPILIRRATVHSANIYHKPGIVLAARATSENERNGIRLHELTVWCGCVFSNTVLQSNVGISLHLPPPRVNHSL